MEARPVLRRWRTYRKFGFNHRVGHPLLLLCNAKAPNYWKKKVFKDLAYSAEWPKVVDAVIKAFKDCTEGMNLFIEPTLTCLK
jgi:hypothetical protein